MTLIDLDNPKDPDFLNKLTIIDENLLPEDAGNFFRIMVTHLGVVDDSQTIQGIFSAVQKVVSKSAFLDCFVSENYLNPLAYTTRDEDLELLLDVVYIVIQRRPDALDSDFSVKFKRIIPYHGRKCLIILQMYASHFNRIEDPWPMLDLLFYERKRFMHVDLVIPFVSLLSLMC